MKRTLGKSILARMWVERREIRMFKGALSNLMKIISWNKESGQKRVSLKEQFRHLKADIVILQEAKKVSIGRRLVASVWGSRFRAWVFIKIKDLNGLDWWLSGVYGPWQNRKRREFWEEMAGLYRLCGPRWCVGGDFNVVRYVNEKSNGGRTTTSMTTFNEFIQDT